MMCACAIANVLANGDTNRAGFGTPVLACGGNKLRSALKDAGVNIDCVVNPIERSIVSQNCRECVCVDIDIL